MGEVGKELLRERIKNKRASEGLDDIPQEELFAKKPRYELSSEEKEKLTERRQRNKEAAEKSRRKKKEEFEKLQMENEQLAQDKCELAAMIEKLKSDLRSAVKENSALRQQTDQLKRWIGKRADSLGLVKHGRQGEKGAADRSVLRGDPSLHPAAGSDVHVTRPESPAYSTKSASPPPPSAGDFQPVGIKTTPRSRPLQTPWLVETPTDTRGQHQDQDEVVITGITPPQSPGAGTPVQVRTKSPGEAIQVGEEQQVVYLPKDTILIVQGEEGSQYLTAPVMPQVAMATPQVVVQSFPVAAPAHSSSVATSITPLTNTSPAPPLALPATSAVLPTITMATNAQPVHPEAPQLQAEDLTVSKVSVVKGAHGDMLLTKTAADGTDQGARGQDKVTEETAARDPSVATAIESLLKLGYKIERPQDEVAMETPMEVITVPVDAPESVATLTVTSSSSSSSSKKKKAKTTTTTTTMATEMRPHVSSLCQQDVIKRLKEAGHVVRTVTA